MKERKHLIKDTKIQKAIQTKPQFSRLSQL